MKFGEIFREHFQKSLEQSHPSWLSGFSEHGQVTVTIVLTGGGAKLPMAQSLGEAHFLIHEQTVNCRLAPFVPEELIEQYPDLEGDYPQLAVSIGGAEEEVPVQQSTFVELGITRNKPVVETQYKGS